MTEQQAQSVQVQSDGTATVIFPNAGSYLFKVSEKMQLKTPPKNQQYSIISLGIKTPAA